MRLKPELTKDFALVADDGRVLFPYQKRHKKTGRYGYACSTPEHGRERDSNGTGGYYTTDIAEVIQGVIFKSWGVRAKMDGALLTPGADNAGSTYQFDKDAVHKYWVASQYRGLVKGALKPPLDRLPNLSDGASEGAGALRAEPALDTAEFDASTIFFDAKSLDFGRLDAAAEIDADPKCKGVPDTERERLVKARIGQGPYREQMLSIWGHKCALTGLAIEAALIASHAKPWKASENVERTNPYNGLLLAASVDRLFDRGLISFSDDGEVLLGPQVTEADLALIGVSPGARLSHHLNGLHKPFLQEHRKLFGFE